MARKNAKRLRASIKRAVRFGPVDEMTCEALRTGDCLADSQVWERAPKKKKRK